MKSHSKINELSLFSGAGGGLLASKYMLNWRTVGYVEQNSYCQHVIRQRILDGHLDDAPIYGDIRTFIDSGCAGLYRGITDVISAGFPCQPFSRAGKKQCEKDARNKWPETSKCIEIIRPQAIQLENVAGLVTNGYINTVFSDLASLRYDFRYDVLPAAAYGADHLRKRLWVIAYASGIGLETAGRYFRNGSKVRCKWPGRASPPKIDVIDRVNRHTEPPFLRKYDGVASWVDRIKAIGNGQHSGVAAGVWTDLTESIYTG